LELGRLPLAPADAEFVEELERLGS
jgi:hypothetical protein